METKENPFFSVEGSKEPGCRVRLTVHVKPNQAAKAYKKALKKINKEISVPGFRKGKAPDATVIEKYGSHVDQEWKELVVNDAYKAALELTEIYPLNREAIEKPKIDSCSLEEGAVVQIAYEHYPEIPDVDFASLSIPEVKREPVDEKELEAIVKEVQKAHADWEDVEGRAVSEDDHVEVSIDALNVDPPQPIVQNRRFDMQDERLSKWLRDLILGLEPGNSAEGETALDEGASNPEFKPTPVRVTLHAIKKIILPEVDDELAKKAGAESLDDMREKIRSNLDKESDDKQKEEQIIEMKKAMLDKYPFDLPSTLVASEKKRQLEARLRQLKSQHVSDEEIAKQEEEIGSQVDANVKESLRLFFLEKQIAKQGELSVSNDEINQELVKQISHNPQLFQREMTKESTRELVSQLSSALMKRKTEEYALEQILAK